MIHLRHQHEHADPEGTRPGRDASASDADLVLAARRGDKRAFVEIVARHQAMVCGIALGILGDFTASEDAGQEAFLTAWRKIHDLREPERLRAWLGQIARHAALGHLRRRRGHETLEDALLLPDDSPAPDEAAANQEEAALVRESLARLPETYRLPLILFYREGQSVRAVAESLALSEDAVKQRLARGRELLRDRMSGLIETVLKRTGPTAVFTMTVAAAIGLLATPAAVAASVFAAASAGAGATSASVPALTAMSTSKPLLLATALVAVVCVPVGFYVHPARNPLPDAPTPLPVAAEAPQGTPAKPPSYEESVLFAEWRQLHETYGRTADAMPALYKAIADLTDPLRRRAFRTALIAEWVQLDPTAGLKFFLGKGPDTAQRRQFLEEWLALDAPAAVAALLTAPPGWETLARDSLPRIARRVPARVAELVARLPKADSYWDTNVREAFALVAESGLASARRAAEALSGPNREQALAGVAQAWAKTDLTAALAWAKTLPAGTDREEAVRSVLLGQATVNPAAALDLVGSVPPGGRQAYFATTTGARVLSEAAKTDFEATVAWVAAHPGRLNHEDLLGLARAVTDRLNADAVGFLNSRLQDGSLAAVLPAISSALLNSASGRRAVVWDWLQHQPNDETTKSLQEQVLRSAGYQDPPLGLRLAAELPRTPQGDEQVQAVASSLLNGGSMLHRFDRLYADAPDRLRQPLLDTAFRCLNPQNLDNPQAWLDRLPQLSEAARPAGVESLARAWAGRSPEEAVTWAAALAPGGTRLNAQAAIASTWAAKDAYAASQWVATLAPGADRDRTAVALVAGMAERFPRSAWDWALTIEDADQRDRAAAQAARAMITRDPATARQWIAAGPFSGGTRTELEAALAQKGRAPGSR